MADDERLVREVEAHRRALAFDVNLCHACGKSWPCLARRLSDRLAASEQEAARLGAALRHYGQHDEACHIARCQYDEQQNVLPGSHCGCGLLQALGATTATEAEHAGPDGGAG
jgi:hypothetical protein